MMRETCPSRDLMMRDDEGDLPVTHLRQPVGRLSEVARDERRTRARQRLRVVQPRSLQVPLGGFERCRVEVRAEEAHDVVAQSYPRRAWRAGVGAAHGHTSGSRRMGTPAAAGGRRRGSACVSRTVRLRRR
eukprot:4923649-Prymnesium_polylepis.1